MIATIVVPLIHRIIALTIAAAVVISAVEMIRRRKLREEYAMLWLGTSLVLTVLAIFPQIPFLVAELLGISNYLTILLLSFFLFLAIIVLQYATAISRDAEHIRQLAQQVALLKEQIRQLRQESEQTPEAPKD